MPRVGDRGVVAGPEVDTILAGGEAHPSEDHLEGGLAGALVLGELGVRDERDEGLAQGVLVPAG